MTYLLVFVTVSQHALLGAGFLIPPLSLHCGGDTPQKNTSHSDRIISWKAIVQIHCRGHKESKYESLASLNLALFSYCLIFFFAGLPSNLNVQLLPSQHCN